MTDTGVFIKHSYWRYELPDGLPTDSAAYADLLDAAMQHATVLSGEGAALYDERGAKIVEGPLEATRLSLIAARQLAELKRKGRSHSRTYLYDSVINPGVGRMTDPAGHALMKAFCSELTSRDYFMGGLQYAVHHDTEHTHLHAVYALNKTLQLNDLHYMRRTMRHSTVQFMNGSGPS